MKRFALLLDQLAYESQRNEKLRLLTAYFKEVPDPDRGIALAALTGTLDIANAKPALLRGLIEERVDPVLFRMSYDYVGDMAETISLLWPDQDDISADLGLAHMVETLNATSKSDMPGRIADWLNQLTATERWALIKLMTGGLRIGVSARLAKTAVAKLGTLKINDIEEVWTGLEPPYESLFAWAEGRADKPAIDRAAPFRPVMLAHPLDEKDQDKLDANTFIAEWKWDGIRVQAASENGVKRLYSRTGDDISHTFPDLIDAIGFDGAIDGELLVMRDGKAAPFSDLQKRLNRKRVTASLLKSHPTAIMAYDLLFDGKEDLRPLPFAVRRRRLEAWYQRNASDRFLLSTVVPFDGWDDLAAQRAAPADTGIEGLMLKRRDSVYEPGRPKGPWFKWKRDPFLIDAVLLYAQRGHGKRSSFYSDYTFGVWDDNTLVPVGKAYFGFTDEELKQIDKFVREKTINRFGPVREVVHEPDEGLVLEVAFEGLNVSTRHKSGVAMRFPRISQLRWDKPPHEADTIETLRALLPMS